jgi:hypothetical protein
LHWLAGWQRSAVDCGNRPTWDVRGSGSGEGIINLGAKKADQMVGVAGMGARLAARLVGWREGLAFA